MGEERITIVGLGKAGTQIVGTMVGEEELPVTVAAVDSDKKALSGAKRKSARNVVANFSSDKATIAFCHSEGFDPELISSPPFVASGPRACRRS